LSGFGWIMPMLPPMIASIAGLDRVHHRHDTGIAPADAVIWEVSLTYASMRDNPLTRLEEAP
jgi:hypothetical protein